MLGGTLTGESLEAKVTPGGDYAIVKDGWGKLDVRVHAVTPENETIYIQYYGQLEITPAVAKSEYIVKHAKAERFSGAGVSDAIAE